MPKDQFYLSGIRNKKLSRSLAGVLSLFAAVLFWSGIFVTFLAPVCLAQEGFEAAGLMEMEEVPLFKLSLKFDYENNKEEIDQTDVPGSYKNRKEQGLSGELNLLMMDFITDYKQYDLRYVVESSEIKLNHQNLSLTSVLNLPLFYLWVSQVDRSNSRNYLTDGITDFWEKEATEQVEQGIGVHWENFRFGYTPSTTYRWIYDLQVLGQAVIQEDIRFQLNGYTIFRNPIDREGVYLLFGVKWWGSPKVYDNRSGSHEGQQVLGRLGYGFSEYSGMFLEEFRVKSTIQSLLELDNSRLVREERRSNTIIGIRFGFSEDSGVILTKELATQTLELANTAYDKTEERLNDEFTIKLQFSELLQLEFSVGKRQVKDSSYDKTILNKSTYYDQSDTVVGFSVKLDFSG